MAGRQPECAEQSSAKVSGEVMSKWRPIANICGWLSLLCWSPYALGNFPLFCPEWLVPIAIYWVLFGCFPATLFALIAATTKNRWWIALAVLSLAALAYVRWEAYKHPFYI